MAKKKKVDTWKTKKWYKVVAPKSFEEKDLGEIVSSDPKKLIDRVMRTSMRELIGSMSHQSTMLNFKIVDVKGTTAHTVLVGHEVQRSYIGRQLKRMKSVISMIIDLSTKDAPRVRATAICFARGKMRAGQKALIRKKVADMLQDRGKKGDFNKLVQSIIFGKASTEMYAELKKVYPISKVEVTKTRILPTAKKEQKE